MFTPRWSPDGSSILATRSDFHKLFLFDVRDRSWRTLAIFNVVDNPAWTADSSSIYFNTRGAPGILDENLDLAVYRIDVDTKKLERIVKLDPPGFPWCGVTPGGAPLAGRLRSIEEVYRLAIRW